MTDLVGLTGPTGLTGLTDLTQLPELDERGILACLENRYNADKIYTGLSEILIAVNPHKQVATAASRPSIEAMATTIARTRTHQSVLCSGESGSGKTESAKRIIKSVLEASNTPNGASGRPREPLEASNTPNGASGRPRDLARQIIASNTLLEAFGNAQTTRNHNSSRFAKFVKLHRDAQNCVISAEASSFLLETSRVTQTPPSECNYHVFYMVAQAMHNQKTQWKYAPNSENRLLKSDPTYSSIESLRDGLKTLGLQKKESDDLESSIRGLLLIGNDNLEAAARELGIAHDTFQKCMTTRTIAAGKDRIVKPLDETERASTRSSVARLVYRTVFQWVLDAINRATQTDSMQLSESWIGILDIFGFESFQTNSYEQFCINYANEKLQNLFNRITLDDEQKLYAREGIRWNAVGFADNATTVQLFDGKPNGMFGLLDSACILRSGSAAAAFCESVATVHSKHPALTKAPRNNLEFTVQHYAGPVKYTCTEFIVKNDDSLHIEALEMLATSTNSVVGSVETCTEASKSKRFRSVGKAFSSQLDALVKTIEQSSVKFIRCLNPNGTQSPRKFVHDYIAAQIRACGLLETVRVIKHGYPYRVACDLITDKYAKILGYTGETALDNRRRMTHACEAIIKVVGGLEGSTRPTGGLENSSGILVGITKIFLKAGPESKEILERVTRGAEECTAAIAKRIRLEVTRSRLRTVKGVARFAARSAACIRRQRALAEFVRTVRIVQVIARIARTAKKHASGPTEIPQEPPRVSQEQSRAHPEPSQELQKPQKSVENSLFVHEMLERLETLKQELDQAKRESETAARLRQEALEASEWNQALAEAAVAREHELLKWQKRAENTLEAYAGTIEAYKVERNETHRAQQRQTECHVAELDAARQAHQQETHALHETIRRKDNELAVLKSQLKQFNLAFEQERRKSKKA